METSTKGKQLPENNEIEETAKNASESNEDNNKNPQHICIKEEKESSVEASDSRKRLIERNEIEKNNLKKMKSDTDNGNNCESQLQNDMEIRKEEEKCFLQLFTLILNTIISLKEVPDKGISERIQPIKDSFKQTPTFYETDFTIYENICAFLYRYGSHGAGFCRFRVLNAIRNCEIVKDILTKPDLKVIILGSSPGNDVVGLCSALFECCSDLKDSVPKRLQLTLVDQFKEWSPWIQLAKIFIEEGDFGKVSELFQTYNVELSFIQTNLPGDSNSDKKYFERLREADVILMSKFLTSLDRKNEGKHEKDIIKSLYKDTKNGVVIIVIDALVYLEDRWRDFELLYKWGEGEENVYKSTALAAERFDSDDSVSSKLPIHIFVKKGTKVYS